MKHNVNISINYLTLFFFLKLVLYYLLSFSDESLFTHKSHNTFTVKESYNSVVFLLIVEPLVFVKHYGTYAQMVRDSKSILKQVLKYSLYKEETFNPWFYVLFLNG